MRIFVLGAGRMGSAIITDLVRSAGKDLELGIGDFELARAQALAEKSGIQNARSYKVNVLEENFLSSVLRGYDAVVNATWYENNLNVMRACLKVGCNYNDLGGLFHMTLKQLQLHEEASKNCISAIVGGGESPGITNVMCALATEGMSSVDLVKIYAGAKETGQSEGVSFPFSVSTVIDEYTKNPVEYINGEYVELPALSGEEEVTFPDPVGKNTCHYSIHSEPATLPSSIGRGIKSVEFRLGISEKMVKTLSPLIEIGLLSNERKILLNGQTISPRDFMVSFFNSNSSAGEQLERWVALKVVATGTSSDGRACRSVCDLVCAPGHLGLKNATAYLTGVAGSIFGQYLAKGRVATGVIAPENAITTSLFVAELENRGIHITKQVTHPE
jgi:lysine 6-dehydrogenase